MASNDTDIIAANGGKANGERIKARSWTASYDRMVANADQSVIELYGVHDGTIFKAGKPYLHVRATHLSVNTITRDFAASGPFHIVTIDAHPQRSFDTNEGQWNDAAQRLTLPAKTTIETGGATRLVVGALSFDVKTGEVDVRNVAGSVRFK